MVQEMAKELVFDTLEYARMLSAGGVIGADVHSAALANSIVENIYTKHEVDEMFEASLKEFAQNNEKIWQKMAEDRARSEREILKMENRIEKTMNSIIYKTVGILGGLIVVLNAITVLAHYFVQ